MDIDVNKSFAMNDMMIFFQMIKLHKGNQIDFSRNFVFIQEIVMIFYYA